MALALLLPVFLFLSGIDVAFSFVAPPANVTLHCQSLNNVLKWEYNQITPGLRFRVDIGAYYNMQAAGFRNVTWVEPPALEADLSFLSDPTEWYYLAVTAVDGEQESEPSPSEDGITFSYDREAEVQQRCFLDLPSVNVTAQPHDTVLLSFPHPWIMLHKKMIDSQSAKTRSKKSHDALLSDELPVFDYTVSVLNQRHPHSDLCAEAVCEKELPVEPHQEEHCLQISGDLDDMLVKGDQVYCTPSYKSPAAHGQKLTYVYVGTGLLAAVLVLILLMVYFKKTKASSRTPLPNPLNFSGSRTAGTLDQEQITVMTAESPTPLLEETDVESCPDFPPASNSADYTLRMRLGVPPEGDKEVSVAAEDGRPSEGALDYMRGGSLDEEDEAPSNYERRAVPVQLESGDLADGYRG